MLHWLVPRKNTGFTLFEMLTTAIIVGVIAAIAAPNLLGLLNRNRVNEALSDVEGAIREGQKQAMREGKSCTVNINAGTRTISGACLLSNRVLDDDIDINADASIQFSGKGNTNSNATIVISSNNVTQQKCIAITSGLGLIRTGNYVSGSCVTPSS